MKWCIHSCCTQTCWYLTSSTFSFSIPICRSIADRHAIQMPCWGLWQWLLVSREDNKSSLVEFIGIWFKFVCPQQFFIISLELRIMRHSGWCVLFIIEQLELQRQDPTQCLRQQTHAASSKPSAPQLSTARTLPLHNWQWKQQCCKENKNYLSHYWSP